MLNLNTQDIKIDYSLQNNNNNQIHNYESYPNKSAKFILSAPLSSSKLFSDSVKEYASQLFKPLLDRLIKAEETDVTTSIYKPINMQTCYNPEVDFSGIVEYIDETINRPPCKRR